MPALLQLKAVQAVAETDTVQVVLLVVLPVKVYNLINQAIQEIMVSEMLVEQVM